MIFRGGRVVSSLFSFSPNYQKITWDIMGGHQMPHVMPPMLYFDNLVKKLDKLSL